MGEDKKKEDIEMLRFIQKANIVDVLAIVWCVTPQVRTNSSLKKQAEFINRLKDHDIWSNVIIIVKQSVNPKYDSRGALAAMQEYADTSKVSVIGYRYVSDQAFS